jgi:DNA-binding HxlR family transcriptional regulator
MALLDLLGRRWALRVLWELRSGPIPTFRELQRRCGDISSSVLAQRLRELAAADVLSRSDGGYSLTPHGRELLASLTPIDRWAEQWATRRASDAASGPNA